MTSKRPGIFVFAFVAVWSLVGLNGVLDDSPVLNVLAVSSAYAACEGDPDEYTGEPDVGSIEEEGSSSAQTSGGGSRKLNLERVGESLLNALSEFFGSLVGKG